MTEPTSETVHATSIAIEGHGVLIMGPSGAGKSDLALRLIDRGATLISDDYTLAVARDRMLTLHAPPNIAGKMEIRHLGLVDIAHVEDVPAVLAIRLDDRPERMPEHFPTIVLAGIPLPLVTLAGKDGSAPIKVEFALRQMVKAPPTS